MLDATARLSLLCCCLLGILAARPAAAGAGDPESTGFVQVPGGSLAYEVRGDGPPLVLLHDGLLPSATWDGQFAVFAESFRVIRYDCRGYGKSTPPPGKGTWSPEDFNRIVLEFLRPADVAKKQWETYRGDRTFETSRDLFAYGTGSLDVTEAGREDRGGVKDHGFNDQARKDRDDWLAAALGVK